MFMNVDYEHYRSESRLVNQSNDKTRITIDVDKRYTYRILKLLTEFQTKIEGTENENCETRSTDSIIPK